MVIKEILLLMISASVMDHVLLPVIVTLSTSTSAHGCKKAQTRLIGSSVQAAHRVILQGLKLITQRSLLEVIVRLILETFPCESRTKTEN